MTSSPTTTEDPMLSISEDLVPSIPHEQSTIVSIDFDGLLTPPLLLQTNEAECGGKLWPAGMVLADYLLRNKIEDFQGKSIVELGAGSGLVGLALALSLHRSKSPSTIHLTDGVPAVLPLLTYNITLNFPSKSLSSATQPALFPWGESIPPSIPKHPDVIVAADCVYFEPSFGPLVDTIEELIGEKTILWFCYKKRRRADREVVRNLMKRFVVDRVEGGWEREGVGLFEISKKKT